MYWLVVISLLASSITASPLWTFYNESSKNRQCGSSVHGEVACTAVPYQVSVFYCYCMTYNEGIDLVSVGRCSATCHFRYGYSKVLQSNDSESLNAEVCGGLKREGQLCGDCIEGYGLPVYSYSMKCVECNEEDFKYNLMKYLCAAFLSLTLFYFLVVILKISITSHIMVASVFICQVVAIPSISKIVFKSSRHTLAKLIFHYVALWNLDFFRFVYTPFCLHPKLNTMQVLALDYLIAVYPMLLIFLTYIAVALHDRYPLIVTLWRPMQRVLTCIRKEWNIRGSLVQAFATFLVLSYVKILNVSFELLNPVLPHNINGDLINQRYLYSAGTIEYFGTKHLPYGILALMMTLVFNILPFLLLMLYPYNTFRKYFCNEYSHGLFIFMDVFHGCYVNQPKDYRWFASTYFISRFIQLLFISVEDIFSVLVFTSFHFLALSLIVMFLQPYKNKRQNRVDVALLLNASICLLFFCYLTFSDAYGLKPNKWIHKILSFIASAAGILSILYGLAGLIFHILPKKWSNSIWQLLAKKLKLQHTKDEDLPLLAHN